MNKEKTLKIVLRNDKETIPLIRFLVNKLPKRNLGANENKNIVIYLFSFDKYSFYKQLSHYWLEYNNLIIAIPQEFVIEFKGD